MLEVLLKRYVTPVHHIEIEVVDEKKEEIFMCEKCDFKAHSTTGLDTHISEKHTAENLKINPFKLFLCDHCSFASNLEEKFRNHQESNHGEQEERLICGQCAFNCKTQKELKEHNEKSHGYILCDICDEFECEWNEIDALETHKELFHEFQCSNCDYKTTTQKGLNIHRGTKHKNDAVAALQEAKEKSTCDKCWLTFSSKETLNKHKSEMHTPTLTF